MKKINWLIEKVVLQTENKIVQRYKVTKNSLKNFGFEYAHFVHNLLSCQQTFVLKLRKMFKFKLKYLKNNIYYFLGLPWT
jgi:hypothetical protein